MNTRHRHPRARRPATERLASQIRPALAERGRLPWFTSGHAGQVSALALCIGLGLVTVAARPASGQALPTGGTVVAGTATITQGGGQMTVRQTTDRGIINWQTFNVGAGGRVDFQQPGAGSATLNRVTGGMNSVIAGQITANGQVFLVNPNGIQITPSGTVRTGAFVASTLDIKNDDFLAGRHVFEGNGSSAGVVNQGTIEVVPGGTVVLMGGRVVNEGSITADGGRVGLASGERVVVDMQGDGFLQVSVPTADADRAEALIKHAGRIQANGGRVEMRAATTADVARLAIATTGTIEARTVTQTNGGVIFGDGAVQGQPTVSRGRVTIDGGPGGSVQMSGSVNLKGGTARGGDVKIDGTFVSAGAVIDASGAVGGTVMINASGTLVLAEKIDASGLLGGGGTIGYTARRIVEMNTSLNDASGATVGGTITVDGGTQIVTSGTYRASGGSAGGRIDITATDVRLLSATLDASGGTQGGLVRVGGAFQGGKDKTNSPEIDATFVTRWGALPPIRSAETTFINDGTRINVAGGQTGGTAIVWSDRETTMLGAIKATGVLSAGSVEISSAETLRQARLVNVELGAGGQLLLDPKNIVVGDPATVSNWLYQAIISAMRAQTNDQQFGASVALSADGAQLAVGAPGDATNTGAVYLFTFTDGSFSGGLLQAIAGDGYTGGKNINVSQLTAGDQFGRGVSLSADGRLLAVGAPGDDGSGGGASNNSGAVYLFSFTDATFSGGALQATIGEGYTGGKNVNVSLVSDAAFGTSVSLSADGRALAVGAPGDDGVGGSNNSGAVRLFTFSDALASSGFLQATIGEGYTGVRDINLSLDADDNFGAAVALSADGTVLAVGAPGDDGSGNTGSTNSGAVRLFTFSTSLFSGGTLQATIGEGYTGGKNINISLDPGANFGAAVALSGTVTYQMAVGAPGDSGAFGAFSSASGAVRLFTFSNLTGAAGTLVATIGEGYSLMGSTNFDISLDSSDNFGSAVALRSDGLRLVVGAPGDDGFGNSGANSGAVYLFSFSTSSFSGTQLVGTIGRGYSGATGGKDVNLATLESSDGFGRSVALSADARLLAVGAPGDDGIGGSTNSGAVYLFTFTDGVFSGGALQATIGEGYTGGRNVNISLVSDAAFGTAVALSADGRLLAVGAPGDDGSGGGASNQSGAVRLFTFTDTAFSGGALQATIGEGYSGGKNVNISLDADDNFGSAVALSADGRLLAVGAPGDDGVGGSNNSGAVRLFTFTDSVFSGGALQATIGEGYAGGKNVNVSLVSDANFGAAVALSADGRLLAVGAPGDDGGGGGSSAQSGAVRLFSFTDSAASGAVLQATIGEGYSGGKNVNIGLNGDDNFGSAVALSADGKRLAVGARGDDGQGNATTDSGAVYVFGFTDTVFSGGVLEATIGAGYTGGRNLNVALNAGDQFGSGVALSADGTRLAVGAVLDDGKLNASTDTGAVYLFIEQTTGGGASPTGQTFASNPADTVTVSRLDLATVLGAGTSVTLQASNDITVAGAITVVGANPGDLTLMAGRSIVLNDAVNTGGGDLSLLANARVADGVIDAHRDAGAATIDQRNGSINAGGGAVMMVMGTGAGLTNSTSGDIRLGTITNAGSVVVQYNGPTPAGLVELNGNITASGAISLPSRDLRVTSASVLSSATGTVTWSGEASRAIFGTAGGELIRFVENGVTTRLGVLDTADAARLVIGQGSATRLYGDANPDVGIPGLVSGTLRGGDTLASLLAAGSTSVVYPGGTPTATTGVGAYGYTVSQTGTTGFAAGRQGYFLNTAAVNGTLTINPAPLNVVADPRSKVYGDANPALTFTATGFKNGETAAVLTGGLVRALGENVGSYAIGQGTLAGANYTITFTGADFTINARPITVTADARSKTYGDADPALTYQITTGNLVGADTLGGSLARNAGENVGAYAILQGTLNNANYAITYVGANLTIGQRAITVTADAKSKTYGDADPALTYQITTGNLVGGDTLSGSLTRNAGENVGTYAILQGSLNNSNYAITYVGANLTIGQRAITVTADARSKTYGDADPALTYQITTGNLVGGDTLSGSLTRNAGENVGTYAILQGTLAASSNYALTYVGANLTIGQRAITVTADARSKTYGDADPALTYQITTGTLVGGDTLSGGLTRNAGENVGAYAILQGSLNNTNYAITYVGANLTIGQRAITVTADARSKTYGDADPALTYQITTGNLVGGDTLSGGLTRNAGENVGTYAILQGSLNNSNYAITYVGANLTIGQRAITVTADAKTRIYGDADPALTFQVTSGNLVGADTLSGGLTRAAGTNVGTYAILQGTLNNANYAITYVGANFTITARPITVTADAKGKIYGDADPALTYQITSGNLVGADTLSGSLTRTAGQNVGAYAILQGTLNNANYAITYVGANLQITPAVLNVVADGKTRVYGDADPALTFTATGFKFADTAGTVLTGGLTRVAGETVLGGPYAILQGTLAANANYTIAYTGATLAITPRAITVTADNLTKVELTPDPAFTWTVTTGSVVFGDTPTGALTRAPGDAVGTYPITQGTFTYGSNYALSFVNGELSIQPRPTGPLPDADVVGAGGPGSGGNGPIAGLYAGGTGGGSATLYDIPEGGTPPEQPANACKINGQGTLICSTF